MYNMHYDIFASCDTYQCFADFTSNGKGSVSTTFLQMTVDWDSMNFAFEFNSNMNSVKICLFGSNPFDVCALNLPIMLVEFISMQIYPHLALPHVW